MVITDFRFALADPFFKENNNVPSIIVKDYLLKSSQGVHLLVGMELRLFNMGMRVVYDL